MSFHFANASLVINTITDTVVGTLSLNNVHFAEFLCAYSEMMSSNVISRIKSFSIASNASDNIRFCPIVDQRQIFL